MLCDLTFDRFLAIQFEYVQTRNYDFIAASSCQGRSSESDLRSVLCKKGRKGREAGKFEISTCTLPHSLFYIHRRGEEAGIRNSQRILLLFH
jgi:hypothetical protein